MQFMKSIVILFSIVLLFIGVTGVDVIKHICPKDGVSVAIMFDTIEHCDEDAMVCCSEDEKDDCCDDEVEVIQVKLDFNEEIPVFAFQGITAVVNPIFDFEFISVEEARVIEFTNSDPPPILMGERLARLQTYLI